MPEPEVVDRLLEGKTSAWTLVRRLMKAGVTVATAVAFTALLPAAAASGDLSPVERLITKTKKHRPDEARILERLTERVAHGLVKVAREGRQGLLGRSLRRLSLNMARTGNDFAEIDFNGRIERVPVNLAGNIIAAPGQNDPAANDNPGAFNDNFALTITGQVGRMPVDLSGFANVNVNTGGPRRVQLNVSGNVGQIPISFNDQTR